MKSLLISGLLICFATAGWTQNNLSQTASTSGENANDLFDLNKYVWSHTHHKTGKGDKPVMAFKDIENYKGIGPDADLSISANGNFFAFSIIDAAGQRDSIVVQSTKDKWRIAFATATPGFFSADSKQYIFQDNEDLCFLEAGSKDIKTIKGIASWQHCKYEWLAYQLKNGEASLIVQNLLTGRERRFDSVSRYAFDKSGGWLACQLNNELKELIIYDLGTGREQNFASVIGYLFDAAGKSLVLHTNEKTTSGFKETLRYVNLLDGDKQTIWQTADNACTISSYNMDRSGQQLVFMVQNSIWYWRKGMEKAVLKVNQQTQGIESDWQLQGAMFTDNDRYIIFFIQPKVADLPAPDPDAVKIDVWSYKDTILQSTQTFMDAMPAKTYRAVIAVEGTRAIRLEKEHERFMGMQGGFAIIAKAGKINVQYGESGLLGDRFWEKEYDADSSWLVSLKDGSRRFLKLSALGERGEWFSPEGKYLVYFDGQRQCNYFSIELSIGKITNISKGIPDYLLGIEDYYLRTTERPKFGYSIAGWLDGDKGILVYDNYDIWQLDLTGKKSPVNITGGYGRKNRIKFSLTGEGETGQYAATNAPIIPDKTPLLLKAFDMQNKYTAVYRKILGVADNPQLLFNGPYTLEKVPPSTLHLKYIYNYGSNTTKATKANAWIVKRQSAREAPNYYFTSDFARYKPLTELRPHKNYNWLTAELHSFKQVDGTTSQGVLYKPENFDSTKKYPVVIGFYSILSNRVHVFAEPAMINSPNGAAFHPGWMTSHGYLVFTPDIYFTQGQWGPSTLNTVDGAAKYLSTLPFVDSKHIGACGHSNSGRTGYYVLTHSRFFAAMAVGSGTTDIISQSFSLDEATGRSKLEWTEVTSFGSGLGNFWQNRTSWLDQTSILHADKVISPLLLFHCKADGVPVAQAIEMFTALRRLGKSAWWLQYDDGDHVVTGKEAMDFTIRYTQFFDHYLKGAPPPRWMTQGIPNKYKQIENRLELDPEGNCGSDCKICQEKKY